MRIKTGIALLALLPALPALADKLSLSSYLLTHQTGSGSASRLQASADGQWETPYGALVLQDGEAAWALPAPGGWVSLGAAYEPWWGLGAPTAHTLAIARYGVELPQDGTLSIGYASRLGHGAPGQLLAANLDAPVAEWRGQKISLQGWASLNDDERRRSLGYAPGSGWKLEQANLLVALSQPLAKNWSLDVGVGSHWGADAGGGRTAGWQTLLGLTWKLK